MKPVVSKDLGVLEQVLMVILGFNYLGFIPKFYLKIVTGESEASCLVPIIPFF